MIPPRPWLAEPGTDFSLGLWVHLQLPSLSSACWVDLFHGASGTLIAFQTFLLPCAFLDWWPICYLPQSMLGLTSFTLVLQLMFEEAIRAATTACAESFVCISPIKCHNPYGTMCFQFTNEEVEAQKNDRNQVIHNRALWYFLKWIENLCPYRNLSTDVYSRFI